MKKRKDGFAAVYIRLLGMTDKKYLFYLLLLSAVVGNTAALAAPAYIGKAIDSAAAATDMDFSILWQNISIL